MTDPVGHFFKWPTIYGPSWYCILHEKWVWIYRECEGKESLTPQCCSAVVVWTTGRWRFWGAWLLLSSASQVVEETVDPSTLPHTLSPATLLQVCTLLSEQHDTTDNNLWLLLCDSEHQKLNLPRSHLTKTLRAPTLHSPHDPPQLLSSLSQVTKTQISTSDCGKKNYWKIRRAHTHTHIYITYYIFFNY